MKIRAITLFADIGPPLDEAQIARLGEFAHVARQAYEADGFKVQTTRLATRVFPGPRLIEFATVLEQACRSHGFEYVSLGPVDRDAREDVPDLLGATESLFVTVNVTDQATGAIDGDAIRGAARVIRQAATVEPGGFANLRFAALANVAPFTPFFPAAYHGGGLPIFALATESADLALSACAAADDAESARQQLTAAIEENAGRLAARAEVLAQAHDLPFGGIDFSLAPFPSPEMSIGTALECLSGQPLGAIGSLAAAAVLTDAIDKAQFPRCGFSGLMLPVLEDTTLAQRVAEGHIQVNDLLQWSALCGTGLDTVPLPGDVSQNTLAALLFDVAALALRLNKPLSARLMPIPGKAAGDLVHFDFAYFTDSRVLSPGREGAPGLWPPTSALHLSPHSPRPFL
ncbi:MAG: DUF711 family protein [Anaerolineae bacterium]|jgi:hypothetical protein